MTDKNHRRVLGAILAGGKSRRFGRDKAAELVGGKPLLDHIVYALRPQVAELAICGRDREGLTRIDDRPSGDLGPLGGLNGALAYAAERGFDAVVSAPVDVLPLPSDLVAQLAGDGPAVFEAQHLLGYWPVSCAAQLDVYLGSAEDVAFHRWLDHIRARKVGERARLFNLNTQADLDDFKNDGGSNASQSE
ncbi:MAG: molybdenum cofactor guanylyltransferase [Parvibaculum sp.]|uniref:molybdenum cofactor guanylyltransferase n=1 Tax=Parvibaculum sp. TaxID=2024848 RepID=UPI0025E2CD77|nr:molybdenum cofactor guanylyltransferase [Parvibaculum sp.]MCE9650493.1 molybdenum cofactor guanylyltransferase [Parvibaculum sp.]